MYKTCSRPINPKTGNFYTKNSKVYKEWANSLTPEQLTEEERLEWEEKKKRIFNEFRRLGLA